jgi:hypothetical protein
MKRNVRALFLMLAFAATYVAAAAPRVAAPDGGPLPLCPPKKGPNCSLSVN